jgi:hypothetical protein
VFDPVASESRERLAGRLGNETPFELLIAKRDMIDTGRQYVDALGRHWNAMVEVKVLRRGGRASITTEEMR